MKTGENLTDSPGKNSNFSTSMRMKDEKGKIPYLDPRCQSFKPIEALQAVLISKEKTGKDVERIARALTRHFLFANITMENRISLINAMSLYYLAPDQPVFEQNSVGLNFYIVCRGKLQVITNGIQTSLLDSGDSFGEFALIHDCPRPFTVKTLTKSYLWILNRASFKAAIHCINSQNYKENQKLINSIPILSALSIEQKNSILENLSILSYKKNQIIVKEGDVGKALYLIISGKVHLMIKGEIISEYNVGDYFGERSLIYHTVHLSTIKTITNVQCIVISSKSIINSLGCKLQAAVYENSKKAAISLSKMFSHLEKIYQTKLCDAIDVTKIYDDGGIVIPSGEVIGNKLWIVIQGKLKSEGKIIAETLGIIGEQEMIEGIFLINNQNIVAVGETHIGEIDKNRINDCLGNRLCSQDFETIDLIKSLKQVSIFQSLATHKLKSIASKLQIKNFNDKEVILSQHTPGNLFFLIKSGRVDILQDGVLLRTERKTDYFGERSLLFDEDSTATVIANGATSCWILNRDDFTQIFDSKLLMRLMSRIELQDSNIHLNELKVVKLLGRGTFGTVYLVVDNIKHRLYALKTVTKRKVQAFKIQDHLLLEKNVLLSLDHSFVLKLIKTFKDTNRIYFLTEYVKGLDLFDVIRISDLFSEQNAKFYISTIIIILEYLHKREIVFRDLKPENVIIDSEGYPKLIDFGAAKFIDHRTYTITGTPHYMAPEIILGYGYSCSADYWSLGIMLYELLFGIVPFGNDYNDPALIYNAILARKFDFPESVKISESCISLIDQLLSKVTFQRLNGSIEKLKLHSWLGDSNWDDLINKEITAPFIPKFSDNNDLIENAIICDKTLDEVLLKDEADETYYSIDSDVSNDWEINF